MLAGCGGPDNAITVNGSIVRVEDLDDEVSRRISIIEKKNPEELEGEKAGKVLDETRRQVATEFIKAELMRQQAKELSVEVTEGDVDQLLEAERARKGSDRFEQELSDQGFTLEGYREKMREQALVEKLGHEVCRDVKVGADEVESFYLTNKGLFSHTNMVHLAHILLETEGRAKMVAEEARAGADFSKLAGQHSLDDATKRNGGDLGWIEQGTMDPALERAAFALESGEVSGAVEASDGFHIIKVLERRDAHEPPFEEVKNEAARMLESGKKEEVFSDWLRTVYANAEVLIPGSLGDWDPALGIVVKH
jgi:foldase protein PrsA